MLEIALATIFIFNLYSRLKRNPAFAEARR